ncbi:MAG: hypothetical protein LBT09_11690 [Planctomycetaceae bacterium]|nr:hypothetical protein [Planctomycetaceae bacterium]
MTDSLGNVTKYKRNSQGQITERTQIAVDETGSRLL